MKRPGRKTLSVFLLLHFVLWFLVGLVRSSIPMDTSEAIVWGGEWTFITNKHPYLSGWVAEIFHTLFRDPRLTASVLAASCSTAAIYFSYRLARQFLDRSRAVWAAVLLEACVYFSVCGLEYNCNMLSMALAPLFFWMAFRALRDGTLRHWIATGLLAGALCMTKYSNGALCAGVALYALVARRDVFRRAGVYLSVALCLAVCAPHFVALVRTDFVTMDYLRNAAASEPDVLEHFLSPSRFLLAQAIAVWGTSALVVWALFAKRFRIGAVHPYLLCIGILPLLAFPAYAAVTGAPLKDLWGFSFVGVLPLVAISAVEAGPNFAKGLMRLSFAVLLVQVCVMTGVALCHTSRRTWLDVESLVRELPVRDVAYVGGDMVLCSAVALHLEQRPRVAVDMDPRQCPWLSPEDMRRRGFLVLTEDPALFARVRKRYPSMRNLREIPLHVKAPFGKPKPRTAYVGYVPANGCRIGGSSE